MKTAQELASSFLTSPAEQKRQAVALRRLAGGVQAAVDRKESTGLTDKEVRTLLDAVAVLNTLAGNHTKAQKITQDKRDAREDAEKAIRAAMRGNFDSLTGIPDQVALIAAVRSYLLRDEKVVTLSDLNYHFTDCFNSLCYDFSAKVVGRTAQDVVGEAWAKFEAARTELQNKYSLNIGRLTLASERAQTSIANRV